MSAWHLDGQGTAALNGDGDARAAHGGARTTEEETARVGDLGYSVARHLEASHLVCRAEAVLVGAHETQRGLAVALKLQHDVDEVFEQARARYGAVFGHVADEQHRQVAVFANADEGGCHLPHLRRTTGKAIRQPRRHRLHGVDDHKLRLHLVDLAEDRCKVGFGGEIQRGLQGMGALGAQSHLADRLFGAHVEHALAGCRGTTCDLEKQRRLADPGLPAEQNGGPGHHAAAEHAVELGDAARPVRDGFRTDLGDRHGLAGGANSGHAGYRGRGIHHRVPLLAFTAAAHPFDARPAALGAAELGDGACHAASLRATGDTVAKSD